MLVEVPNKPDVAVVPKPLAGVDPNKVGAEVVAPNDEPKRDGVEVVTVPPNSEGVVVVAVEPNKLGA